MRLAPTSLCLVLGLATALAGEPAWAKGKKKKKAPPPENTPAARLYLYDPDHPTTPTVLILGEGEPKVPEAPLLALDGNGKAKATSPAIDKATDAETQKSPK